MFLKTKRIVNGIPSILAYYPGPKEIFYEPNDSCLGGNINNTKEFFERCLKYVN